MKAYGVLPGRGNVTEESKRVDWEKWQDAGHTRLVRKNAFRASHGLCTIKY